MIERIKIPYFCLAGGIGAGAKGFNAANPRLGNLRAEFECLGGVDNDPGACANFKRIVGVKQTCLDLFSREQYERFHGRPAPADYHEATPGDIFNAAQRRYPWVIFGSLPCKGFSGLLSETKSKTAKYQALNELTLRSLMLTLEAFKDNPALFILFENVPRIQTRGRYLLDQIIGLLQAYGYATAETTHDCGELGGLAQSRKRFLLVARHYAKLPTFVYEPPKRRLRSVGEILEKMPLPGDPAGGPLHRIPMLQMKTWLRLAFVIAGQDWRSLNRLRVEDGFLKDYVLMPEANYHRGALGVVDWPEAAGTVTSNGRPAAGRFSVADPRVGDVSHDFHGMRTVPWDKNAPAVTTQRSPGSSALSVADPRIDGHHKSVQHGVLRMSDTAGVVTGKMHVGGGHHAVADPRYGNGFGRHYGKMRVEGFDGPSHTVTGSDRVGSGALSVADPRLSSAFNHVYRVVRMDEASPAVSGAGPRNAAAVADPRPPFGGDYKQIKYKVTPFDRPAGTVIGASTTGNGAFAVADPRQGKPSHQLHGKYHVNEWGRATRAVIGHREDGAQAVADPRLGMDPDRPHFRTNAQYGVLRMDQSCGAVSASAQHDSGPWSVADHRLPAPSDRLIALIVAEDNTWHRPFTTLELAALQSLVDPEEMFTLEGTSDSQYREWIGNAVPPAAAEAIGGVIGRAVLAALTGEVFSLSLEPVWVQPVAIALQFAQVGA